MEGRCREREEEGRVGAGQGRGEGGAGGSGLVGLALLAWTRQGTYVRTGRKRSVSGE